MRYDDQVRGELEELSKSLGFRYVPKEELEDGLTRLRKDIRDGSLASGPEDGLLLSFWDHAGWPPILCLWKKSAAYGQEGSGAGQGGMAPRGSGGESPAAYRPNGIEAISTCLRNLARIVLAANTVWPELSPARVNGWQCKPLGWLLLLSPLLRSEAPRNAPRER